MAIDCQIDRLLLTERFGRGLRLYTVLLCGILFGFKPLNDLHPGILSRGCADAIFHRLDNDRSPVRTPGFIFPAG
ncbi:MAG: hypothetical protein ABSG67_03445 [Thermoguttaceae bacterium]|jgi:hypothetical protein